MKRYALILFIAVSCCLAPSVAPGQQPSGENGRKVVRRVEPKYPEIARKMNLTGTVRVVALVASDGSVTKVEPVGGSPVLLAAAEDAISKWKYVPGGESREMVEMKFTQ